MITIKLKGGLGNQMFEYAYGRNLSLQKKEELFLDVSSLESTSPLDTKRNFGLDVFTIQAKIVHNKKKTLLDFFDRVKAKITGNNGFYQSETYFKENEEAIRKDFTLKNPLSPAAQKIADEIALAKNPVSLHIRRGDYVSNPHAFLHHGVLQLSYYELAVKYIKEKVSSPTFFIISDDIEWARKNLKLESVIYVSQPEIHDYEEIILMSMCKHHIIANSSFSWWGAWLNKKNDKIVVAPRQWLAAKTADELGILPPSWIRL